ncbi:hypothetical protein [Endozoicomonas sp. SCSIO W0465]|uniref:hypothetical protein n=1 Tax=Endozoicomonas sp. SCSIO W0465 TaxID=2918516 RepID=UPI0020759366|nr:hypothetical protein [Endozoicomonas sp. SCSIO W0465]USE36118.1 hypothetical protein MJO57_29420 [Endozoicomonas sp. SCSIO W0465]
MIGNDGEWLFCCFPIVLTYHNSQWIFCGYHPEEIIQAAEALERDSGKARIRGLVRECGELQQENKSILLVNARQQGKVD